MWCFFSPELLHISLLLIQFAALISSAQSWNLNSDEIPCSIDRAISDSLRCSRSAFPLDSGEYGSIILCEALVLLAISEKMSQRTLPHHCFGTISPFLECKFTYFSSFASMNYPSTRTTLFLQMQFRRLFS